MCIISEPVESVAKTKILVALDATGMRQLTVYANAVENYSEANAMLLPVPNPQTVQFHDLSNYKNIFSDCDSCFYKPISRGFSDSLNASYSNNGLESKLKVFDVGSYKVSLAMGVKDLKRVDKSVFSLSDGCAEMMSQEYSDPVFGFIICKLNTGREEYHPMSYSHKLSNGKMFIPTKHYHAHRQAQPNIKLDQTSSTRDIDLNGMKYDASNINNSPMFANNGLGMPANNIGWKGFDSHITSTYTGDFTNRTHQVTTGLTEDWAHEIYLYNGTNKSNVQFKNMSRSNELWTGENLIKTKLIDFDFSKLAHFEKHKIHGYQKNVDLDASVELVPNYANFSTESNNLGLAY